MPPPGGRNAIVGAFFLAAIIGAVAITAILTDAVSALTPTSRYTVEFSLDENAGVLAPGSEVRVGGRAVGTVDSVTLAPEGEPPTRVDVVVEVERGVVLHADATVQVELPLFGTGAVVNVVDSGGGAPRLAEGARIAGRAAPGLLAQAGLTGDDIERVRRSITALAEASERANAILGTVEPQVGGALESFTATMDDARSITADVRERVPRIADGVESTIAQAGELADRWTALAGSIERRAEQAGELLASAQGAIDENRPGVRDVIADLRELASRTRAEVLPDLASAADNAQRASAQAATLLEQESPGLRRMLANLRLASDQAKLAMLEIRRSPWRLLQRPSTRELESELVYDAARSFATAASDLRAASDSLLALSTDEAGPVDLTGRERAVRSLHEELVATFDRFRQAEQALLDRAMELEP